MKAFNLKKMAKTTYYTITEKMIQENREEMHLCTKAQGVDGKNINLSLPIKDKDNTVPFDKQLEAARTNKEDVAILEKRMDDKIVSFGDKTEGVTPINAKSEELNQKKLKDYKKAEKDSKNDTKFWDKYVGVQLEGKKTTVDNNIPANASQLQNNPERFKGKNIDKMVMAAIKDADAMLFHIYASAAKANRGLNEIEKQQIIDINAGKMRILSTNKIGQTTYPTTDLGIDSDMSTKEIIQTGNGKYAVLDENSRVIGVYPNRRKAQEAYPDAKMSGEDIGTEDYEEDISDIGNMHHQPEIF
jgi:hypothetical protein